MLEDCVWINARIATLTEKGNQPYGVISPGGIASHAGRIAWVGPMAEMPTEFKRIKSINLRDRWMTPGLIDAHSHLIFAGNRAQELKLRLTGVSYQDIAQQGGGINATVAATRLASESELVAGALLRLDALIAEGVTTIEIKSGYGLETEAELRMLRAARALAKQRPIRVTTTFLGAHALPPEAASADSYIEDVINKQLPRVIQSGLADAVDAFCETIAFSPAQTRRVFEAAQAAQLPVKLHADQLSDSGGAALAAEFGALSADHLEYTHEEGVIAMARAGTVAMLLPGAFYTLGETRKPPISAFRTHGVAMGVATDCNPGSSPLTSILLALNMASTLFGLTPEESLFGATRYAAQALGLAREVGTLKEGKACDLAIWDIEHPDELAYHIGFNPLYARVLGGVPMTNTQQS